MKENVIVFIDAFTKFLLMYRSLRLNAACTIKALSSSVALFCLHYYH